MYKVKFASSGFGFFKDLGRKSAREFQRLLQTEVKREIELWVDRELSVEPGPVRHPFVFHSDPVKNAHIRAAFFATQGFGRGLGAPRTHALSSSWAVRVAKKATLFLVSVYNNKKYAKYVYPPTPYQIPGHINTGWGRDFLRKFVRLEALIDDRVSKAWYKAVVISVRKN